jgi:hypothetical protein
VKLLSEPGTNSDAPPSKLQLSALSISLTPNSLTVRELEVTASLTDLHKVNANAAGDVDEQCDESCKTVPVFQRQQEQHSAVYSAPSDLLMIDWQQQRRASSVSTNSSRTRGSSSIGSTGSSSGAATTTAVVCAQLQPFLVLVNTHVISR